MKTEQELKQIAVDYVEGRIFSDREMNNPQDSSELQMVFMPLALMSPQELKPVVDQDPVFIFEYLKDAGPRSCNGMPGFFSFQFLTRQEFDIFAPFVTELLESRTSFMEATA